MNAPGDRNLDDEPLAIWIIEVCDPHTLITSGMCARIEDTVTELCSAAGCQFLQHTRDGEPEVHRWSVRLPRTEHHRRNDDDVPFALAALVDYLRTHLPDQTGEWSISTYHAG